MKSYINIEEILHRVRRPDIRPIYEKILAMEPRQSIKVPTTARYLKQAEGGRSGVEGFRRSVSRFIMDSVNKYPELEGRRYTFHCSVYEPQWLTVRRVQ